MSFSSRLFQYFPPPKFLTPTTTGLSVSDDALRLLSFEEKKHGAVLESCDSLALSKDVIVSGEIQNADKLHRALKEIGKKHDLRFVKVCVPERKAYIVKMRIPRVEDVEIREVVALHLDEYVPVRAGEAVFDYEILRVVGATEQELELQVSVINKEVVGEYLEVFAGTGITLTSLEIEAQAVARAVVPRGSAETSMIVDFGVHRTGIYMVTNGLVEFTTSIDMSGQKLNELFEEKFGAGPEVVKQVKKDFNCLDCAVHEEDEQTAILMSFVASFRDEISKHLSYWKTHHHSEDGKSDIHKIILTGSESYIPGLPEYLSGSLSVQVAFANVWQNVFDFEDHIPEIEAKDSFQYAGAIGLALQTLHR